MNGLTIDFDDVSSYATKIRCYERILDRINQQINNLTVSFPHYRRTKEEHAETIQWKIRQLISSHLKFSKVEHCVFNNFGVEHDFTEYNKYFFRSLLTFEWKLTRIDYEYRNCLYAVLPLLDNTQNLKIDVSAKIPFGNVNDILPLIKHEKLETLRMLGFRPNKIEFTSLPINLTLKHLEAPRNLFDPELLVQHFPNLEFLEIGHSGLTHSLVPLVNLSKLKHLSLIYGKNDYDHVFPLINELAGRNQLETFKMNDDFHNDNNGLKGRSTNLIKSHKKMEKKFADNLKKMTNLKTLGLNTIFTFEDHLEELASSLNELCHFEFGCTFGRCGFAKEEELIPKIRKFVEKSDNLVKLVLKFHVVNFNLQRFYDQLVNIRRANGNVEVLVVEIQQHKCKKSKPTKDSTSSIQGCCVEISYTVEDDHHGCHM